MDLNKKRCVPCEGLTNPLNNSEEDNLLNEISNWNIDREGVHKLIKEYKLLNFVDAIKFVNQIAEVAENEGHHPNISIRYNIVLIEIYTHAIDGLSENDFILASKIDETFSNGFINN